MSTKQKTIIVRQKIIRQVTLDGIRESINRLNSILCEYYDKDLYTYESFLADVIGYNKDSEAIYLPYFKNDEDYDKYKDCFRSLILTEIGYYFDEINIICDDDKKLLNRTTDWLMHFDKTLLCLIEYLTK